MEWRWLSGLCVDMAPVVKAECHIAVLLNLKDNNIATQGVNRSNWETDHTAGHITNLITPSDIENGVAVAVRSLRRHGPSRKGGMSHRCSAESQRQQHRHPRCEPFQLGDRPHRRSHNQLDHAVGYRKWSGGGCPVFASTWPQS